MWQHASYVTRCISVTSVPFVSVVQKCRGLLMLEANTKQENNPPLGGGNEAQRVEPILLRPKRAMMTPFVQIRYLLIFG